MKPFESEDKNINKPTPKKSSDEIFKLELPQNTALKTVQKQSEDQIDSADKDDLNQRFSMSRLCQAFIDRCSQSTQKIFDTRGLVQEFGVKQRRIYDLMNIMEGSGCLKKLSKGKYEWLGVENSESVDSQNQKGDSTSLRQIAARIKLLFSQSKGLISFAQINDLLLKQNKQKSINPSSIRRRIYQCCKVLRILGFIDKIGKHYQSVSDDQPRAQVPVQEAKKNSNRRIKRQQLTQNQLISQIIRRYGSVEKINEFIEKLNISLNSQRGIKKQQTIYEEQK